ncbi:hypothetical protein EW145_g6327 [Phellinidium pouzarii]|uniref:Uncharacterized protein n=1 Tax=Phellinidium pouzarii TaxID=167371 RepID=A0A4S4KWY1_9AGAM|nr:hypothetical protein EW145_g6327 [Phellinidium pouzarii]
MDDILEQPTSSVPNTADDPDDAAQSSDEDDGGPDWTKLSAMASASDVNKPFIPKRGEKEFEPSGEAGTSLQQHKLEQMRAAMFSALDVERTVSR